MIKKRFLSVLISVLVIGCAGKSTSDDKYLWLEDIEGEKALTWVKKHNEITAQQLKANPSFKTLENELKEIIVAKDRIPYPQLFKKQIYNFWQDEKHVKGIWRRSSLKSYGSKETVWQTVIDLDELSKKEKMNWVWKGAKCFEPKLVKCLVFLSNGGKDATEVREFDLEKLSFVDGGFKVPEAKQRIDWIDENHVIIGTNWGKDSLTVSGYPKIVKIWERGQALDQAKEIFRGQDSDVSVDGWTTSDANGHYTVVSRALTFYEGIHYILVNNSKLTEIPVPKDAELMAIFNNQIFYKLRTELKSAEQTFEQGTILAIGINQTKLNALGESAEVFSKPVLIAKPSEGESFESLVATANSLYLIGLKNVQSVMFELKNNGSSSWAMELLDLPSAGNISLVSANAHQDDFIISFESFLKPTTLLLGTKNRQQILGAKTQQLPKLNKGAVSSLSANEFLTFKSLKSLPSRFDAKNMVVDQHFAVSKDGTKVPYFVLRNKETRMDGKNPTLLYGYGGFEQSMSPYYASTWGRTWLSRGGVYVLANIRGGGEFGPKWHYDGIKEKKQNVFDDFYAVAEDLTTKGISSPSKLGIMGGSNGGLLVGASFVQRPDLFKAVVCQVPLLDMLRYHKLLAGNSWINEYGNPDEPEARANILKYSPFQNVKANEKYPKVFFITSTKDDRVHPGHARKMVAKMEDLGYQVFYYENTAGGHAADSDLNDKVFRKALEYSYLINELMN